jgi:curved DNA-binding protein CbpA
MDEPVNYYAVLGVLRTATPDEIRKQFREMARSRHPDQFPPEKKAEAENQFQQLTLAYNVLTNANARSAHDMDLDSKVVAQNDPKAISLAYLEKGIEAYRDGRWDAALTNFEMAVRQDPDNPKIHHHLAMAALRFPQKLRLAVSSVEKSLELDPRNAEFLKDAGLIFRQAGLWTRAEKCYREAMRWNPDSADLRHGLEEAKAHRPPRA